MKDKHFTSRMFICAGALMLVSGLLISISVKLVYGGVLFASAACMFSAAHNFRIAEDKKEEEERKADEGQEKT